MIVMNKNLKIIAVSAIAIILVFGVVWFWLQNGITILPGGQILPTKGQVVLTEGQQDGPLLIQKIYTDHIDGLEFVEYPIAILSGRPITLHIGESATNGCTVTLTLLKIEDAKATFSKKVDNRGECPVCLSENTYIDTPNGYIPVQDLQKGMAVWTVDATGSRNVGIILETTMREVPSTHTMVHLVLSDGRELFASPWHPLEDGRAIDSIVEGDNVDSASVTKVQQVPYNGKATYDILPSGGTGLYWANDIPVKSTLAK